MVKLLEPFETITRRLSGATYPTLNMIHPYMYMLKQMFAPKIQENETLESYFNLIYGSFTFENTNEEELNLNDEFSFISDDDDNIPTAGNRQHWQYTYQQFRERMRNRG